MTNVLIHAQKQGQDETNGSFVCKVQKPHINDACDVIATI